MFFSCNASLGDSSKVLTPCRAWLADLCRRSGAVDDAMLDVEASVMAMRAAVVPFADAGRPSRGRAHETLLRIINSSTHMGDEVGPP